MRRWRLASGSVRQGQPSRPQQEADGIIIGSKLMRLVEEGGPERAGGWLREVREALSGVVEGWRLGIRNWLSKRREYSRSAPETESGVGPMDAVFTKCEQVRAADLREGPQGPLQRLSQLRVPLPALRAGEDKASYRRGQFPGAGRGHLRRRSPRVRGLPPEAGEGAREDRARRRHTERDRRHRGEAGGARRARLQVYRGFDGERRR